MSFDGGARRTEILETAAHLFASSGLKTSLKEIADACGILPGSLYHHFDSKESIIVELIEQYRNDLDAIAEQARVRLRDEPEVPIADEITRLGRQIVACALRHRAALLLTFYEPPSGAGDELVRVARRTPEAIEAAALETFRVGRSQGYLRDGVDLELLADRFCQVMLHVGLGAFADLSGVEQLAEIRCRILFEGIATRPPDDAVLDRSAAMAAARDVLASWESTEKDEDERLTTLRAIARTEFGRKGYEATTVRDIASAAGLSTGSVYRLVGSKDELLATIMRSFVTRVREGWRAVLTSGSTALEKLDALMWVNIGVVDRYSDEFNIQLAWLRESPPKTANLGFSFTARLRDVEALLAEGRRSGEVHLDGPTAELRAWSLFELLWVPENIVRQANPGPALAFARDTVLRGAAAG